MNSFVSDFGRPLEPDKVFSRQGNEESRSLFHCYINEVDQLDKAKACFQTTALDSNVQLQEAIRRSGQPEEELNRLMKFDIPNFVNTDQNSSFGEDDLLISEPPIVLENKPVAQTPHKPDLNFWGNLSSSSSLPSSDKRSTQDSFGRECKTATQARLKEGKGQRRELGRSEPKGLRPAVQCVWTQGFKPSVSISCSALALFSAVFSM